MRVAAGAEGTDPPPLCAVWYPGISESRRLEKELRDLRIGRHDEGLLANVPDGRCAVDSPDGHPGFQCDHLGRDEIEILTRAEIGVDVLAAENRHHDVPTRTADSGGHGDNAALQHALRPLPL